MKKGLLLFPLLMCSLASCKEEIEPEKPEEPIHNREGSLNHDKIYYYNENKVPYASDQSVRQYTFLTPYLAEYPTGGAIIVFPGGAYTHLSNSTTLPGDSQNCTNNDGEQREASDIATFYNEKGISVFVCNYRTKGLYTNPSTNYSGDFDYHQLLSDGFRALKYVRYNASKYFVDKNKIGVLGYSAGGNLASEILTLEDFTIDDPSYNKDRIDAVSGKPNAGVFGYGVLTFKNLAHKTTMNNFCGKDDTAKSKYSPEDNIKETTSPAYIWAEKNDGSVNYEGSVLFSNTMTQKGVKNELHIFEDTESHGTNYHGIGCAQQFEQAKVWPTQSAKFLKGLGF